MTTGTSYAFTVQIDNLGAGNIVNVSLQSGSGWILGFDIQPESPTAGPLSIGDLNLQGSSLSITAGSAPLSALLTMNVTPATPPYLGGTTVSNDPNCHVKAQIHPGSYTDMMGNWTINFG